MLPVVLMLCYTSPTASLKVCFFLICCSLLKFQLYGEQFTNNIAIYCKVTDACVREANAYNFVAFLTSEGVQIHLNLVAIRLTPTIHFDRQITPSLLKPTFTLSSSACSFIGLSFYLLPSASWSNALLKTQLSSLLNT